MKDFIFTYWREILYVICALVSLVLFIVRKPSVKVVDSITERILLLAPAAISKAEEVYGSGHGSEKFLFVIDLLKLAIEEDGFVISDKIIKFMTSYVEAILSTPQKKEAKK